MKRGLFIILFTAVVLLFGAPEKAQAAVASIDLQTESDTVRVGEEFEVTLWINVQPAEGESPQAAIIGDFEAYLIYNADVMEFVTAPSCITGGAGAGMLRIADIGVLRISWHNIANLTCCMGHTGQVKMTCVSINT